MVLDKDKVLLVCFYNLLLVICTPAKNSSPKPTFMTTVNVLRNEENNVEDETQHTSPAESM